MTCCCGVIAGGMLNATAPPVLNSATITELVRNAGGNVNALFRASLAWDSWSDVDFHMKEQNGEHIYYSHKTSAVTGGKLDVDMNINSEVHSSNSRSFSKPAVENIMYTELDRMPDGDYALSFVQYGVNDQRTVGADRPYLLFEHRTPDEEPMSHFVLLKNNGDNLPANSGYHHKLATVRKTGNGFRLVELAPNTEILENHNFDIGAFGVSGSTTGSAAENAVTSGVNPTGG